VSSLGCVPITLPLQTPAALLAATEVSASSESHVYRPVPLFGKDFKLVILRNHAEAVSSTQSALWKQAEEEETESLLAHGTWDLVRQPAGRVRIGGPWVYSLKDDPQGRVIKFNALWVAKGYSQREGRDYGETFASTGKHTAVRVYVAEKNLDEVQADVPTAFLNGEIEEELFVQQPEGYEMLQQGCRMVCRLRRSLYDLKQSPRQWQRRLQQELDGWEFVCCDADASLYRQRTALGDLMYMLVYVDDFKLAGLQGCAELHTCVQRLKETFGVRFLPAAACFIGFKMTRNCEEHALLLSQPTYTRKQLAGYGMQDANAYRTLMTASCSCRLLPPEVKPAQLSHMLLWSVA
jgi:hypothetical protein